MNVIQRRRLSGRTWLRCNPREVCKQNRTFCLTKPFPNFLSSQAFPLFKYFRVQRFAGCCKGFNAGKIIAGNIFLQHKPIHGRRCTEGCQFIVLHMLQQVGWNEFLHIISKDCSATDPLSIDFAPSELCPAGIGYAHVQLIFLYLLPIFCSGDMTQRMRMVMLYHFRLTSCTGSEVDDCDVIPLVGSFSGRTFISCWESC